jgi:hypothetical protein
MSARAVGLVLVAVLALAACEDEQDTPKTGVHSPEGVMIRDWLMAVKNGDYDHAADFFAPGAIIDQGRPFRLETHAAARLFNAGLPCHADLIALRNEKRTVLATFRLLPGPGGPCEGRVKVRYTIEDGRFTEWRQFSGDEPVV